MKFILHQSASSINDAQSSAWARHLYLYFKTLENISCCLGLKELSIGINTKHFMPKNNQEHHLVLLTEQDDLSFLDYFKALDVPPRVIWSGLSIPHKLLEQSCDLPDVMIIPEWLINCEDEVLLSDRTLLIKSSFINNEYAELHEREDFALYFKDNAYISFDNFPENILAIQLEGNIKGSCYYVKKHRDDFNVSIQHLIQNNNLNKRPLTIIVVPPIYSRDDNLADDQKHTSIFIGSLGMALRMKGVFNFNIIELKESADKVSASEALIFLAEQAKRSLILVPSSEQNLLARTQLCSFLGVDVFSYGLNQSAVSNALLKGEYLRQVSYQFSGTASNLLKPPLAKISGKCLSEGLEMIATKLMDFAKLRDKSELSLSTPERLRYSPALFMQRPIAKSPRSVLKNSKTVLREPLNRCNKDENLADEALKVRFDEYVEKWEREKYKERNSASIYKDNNRMFWTELTDNAIVIGGVVAVAAWAYSAFSK